MLASGLAVANLESANWRGVWLDWLKSIEEKVVEPEVTSGTPEIVFLDVEQVTVEARLAATSATSAGSVVEPITKQALAALWRATTAAVLVLLRVITSVDATKGILGRAAAVAVPVKARVRAEEARILILVLVCIIGVYYWWVGY